MMHSQPASIGMFPPNSKKKQILNQRCMRAEDEKWDKYIIPTLRMKCLQCLTQNFEEKQILEELNEEDRATVVDMLPTNLTLNVKAESIPEESYWKRCCKDSGDVIILQCYGGSWRRAFFERHAQRRIQDFHPGQDDLDELLEEMKICQPFVKQLRIEQLWQKIQPDPVTLYYYGMDDEDDDRDNPLMPSEDCQCLQFTTLMSVFSNVTELDLSFSAKECGENFSWNLLQITEKDCEDLGKALKERVSLTVLRIRRSRIEDQQVLTLLYALEGHPNLQTLDLSHNRIGDLGAKATAKLIKGLPVLEDFNIMNNLIGAAGSECLAYSIANHSNLKTANLSMNSPCDAGGILFSRALAQNSVLQTCVLNASGFGFETCKALGEMLSINSTLLSLSLINNDLGEEGGELLLAGLEQNCVILTLDVRMCRLGEKLEYEINRKLKYNKHREEKSYVLPRPYSALSKAELRSVEATPRDGRSRASFGDLGARSRGSVTSRTSATRKSSALSTRSALSKKSVRSLKSAVSKVTSKIS